MGYSINANEANALARSNLENIDQGIFRAYDIRGIVGKSLTLNWFMILVWPLW